MPYYSNYARSVALMDRGREVAEALRSFSQKRTVNN